MNSNFDFDPKNGSRMSKSKCHINDIKGYIDAIIRLLLLMIKKEEWFDMRDKEDERYNLEGKKGWVQLINKSMWGGRLSSYARCMTILEMNLKCKLPWEWFTLQDHITHLTLVIIIKHFGCVVRSYNMH